MKTFRFSKVRPTAQICTPFYTRDIPVQIGTHFLPSLVSPRMIFEFKNFLKNAVGENGEIEDFFHSKYQCTSRS